MADTKDSNEGYEFPELDGYTPEAYNETSEAEQQISSGRSSGFSDSKMNPVWRNGIIVLAGVIVLMLAYKFFGNIFSSDKKEPSQISAVPKQQPVEKPKPEPLPQVVQQPVQPVYNDSDSKEVRQKLSRLELSQQNISSNVGEIESKLNGLDGNVTDLSGKLSDITQQLSMIAEKLDSQANAISVLKVRLEPKKPPKPKKIMLPPVKYYIQAVIPGRAWLIGSNGSTITVSKGSRIASYGRVNLIDAQQGRVIMSSGRIIQFEQQEF